MTDVALIAIPAICFIGMLALTLRALLRGDRELLHAIDERPLDPGTFDFDAPVPVALPAYIRPRDAA